MSNIMKKGKSQQRKLVVAFPKGLCLSGCTGSFGSRVKPRRAGCCCAVPLLAPLPVLAPKPLLPQGCPLSMRGQALPSANPRKTLLALLSFKTSRRPAVRAKGDSPSTRRSHARLAPAVAPSPCSWGWLRVGPCCSGGARALPAARAEQHWVHQPQRSCPPLVLGAMQVVSTVSWSTAAQGQSSPENAGSSYSSCRRSYFE